MYTFILFYDFDDFWEELGFWFCDIKKYS